MHHQINIRNPHLSYSVSPSSGASDGLLVLDASYCNNSFICKLNSGVVFISYTHHHHRMPIASHRPATEAFNESFNSGQTDDDDNVAWSFTPTWTPLPGTDSFGFMCQCVIKNNITSSLRNITVIVMCYAVGLINSERNKNTLVSDCLQNPPFSSSFDTQTIYKHPPTTYSSAASFIRLARLW